MTGYVKEIKKAVKALAKATAGKAQFNDNAFTAEASEDGRNVYVKIDYRKADPAASKGIREMCDAMEAMRFFSSRMEHGEDASEMMYSVPNNLEAVTSVNKATHQFVAKKASAMVEQAFAMIDQNLSPAQAQQAKRSLIAQFVAPELARAG